jgi:hypothetical protein
MCIARHRPTFRECPVCWVALLVGTTQVLEITEEPFPRAQEIDGVVGYLGVAFSPRLSNREKWDTHIAA